MFNSCIGAPLKKCRVRIDLGFLARWFLGPLGERFRYLLMREIGLCSDMEARSGFIRESLSFEGLQSFLAIKDLNKLNIFMGVGFWLASSGLEPSQSYMLYDRVVFDFDSEDNPQKAVNAALQFSSTLTSRYKVDPIVFRSGFKGAHVVIPLSRPTDWEGYQLLWDHLFSLVPKGYRDLVDRNMKQWNRLDRVPFTYNIKGGRRVLAEIIYPENVEPSSFDWARLRGLDPENVEIYRVELPKPIAPKTATNASGTTNNTSASGRRLVKEVLAPCMKRIFEDCRRGINLSHNARVALASYLLNIGYSVEEVVEVFKTQPDFKERVTRYHVEHLAGLRGSKKRYLPYSCAKMKEMGLCVSDCGTRNPLSHNRLRAVAAGASSTTQKQIIDLPKDLALFTKDTGLTEFSYEDFRRWLESKQSSLDASTWHHYERLLREWAERGFLGRRYLVGGAWVDYGPGKITKPPSKEVRFYIVS